MKNIFLLLFIIPFIFSCTKNENNPKIIEEPLHQVTMVMVGDNLIHQTIYQSVAHTDYDFKPIYQEIKPYISLFDLAFINQETILGGTEIGLSSYPAFNSPYELGDALVDAGFNLISLANNHTLDRGEIGVKNSVNYWNEQPVITSGSVLNIDDDQVKVFEKNNIRFAFVAYTYGTNGIRHPGGKSFLANVYSDTKAANDLRQIKDKVDIIIVSMHWGDEYQNYPNEEQKRIAQYLSSLGAQIIIGHHPHVIQPIEIINNDKTVVIYSLGNFLSDQKGINRLIGMAVSLIITKVESQIVKINISDINAKLLYRYKDEKNQFIVKWFNSLNQQLLLNYELYLDEKTNLIQTYNQSIKVG